MTLIELTVSIVVVACLGAGVGALVGWVGSWPLLLSAGVGAGSAVLVGAVALFIAISMADRSKPDESPAG